MSVLSDKLGSRMDLPASGRRRDCSRRPPSAMRATFRLIPAAYASTAAVQAWGLEDICLLTHRDRLVCDSTSSGQWFAFGLLQIPLRNGHPCRSADCSPCRASSVLSPPSHPATTACTAIAPVKALRAMPGAQKRATAPRQSLEQLLNRLKLIRR